MTRSASKPRSAIVQSLVALIAEHGWQSRFEQAVEQACSHGVASLAGLRGLDDYLRFIDEMVYWAPRETGDSRLVHDKLVEFYFVLDQPALRGLQSPIDPGPQGNATPQLSPLSRWISAYAESWGSYLDTLASAQHIESFRSNPAFRWSDYMPPPSGYRSFNQFFARHVKPGYRPVAQMNAAHVIAAPADAVYKGAWPLTDDAMLELKGIRWAISQLLDGSEFAPRFAGGIFTHSALRTFDYHRWHAPLAGTVIETRIIAGQAYLDVVAVRGTAGGATLKAVEGVGYQFVQSRGLVILETAFGLVACLPVGMAQVSSVVITAEAGRRLNKGEEMGYFQFGGSDFVMVFEASCKASFSCSIDAHSLQGSAVGVCHR